MTEEQMAEYRVLKLANELGKFALEIAADLPEADQFALERLQLRGWLRLLDISPLTAYPKKLFRVFLASGEAMDWYKIMDLHIRKPSGSA